MALGAGNREASDRRASKWAMADPRLKQLRIKAGVLKRAAKEREMYDKELDVENKRLLRMQSEGKDEHDLRHQGKVIEECAMMVPDSRKRLLTAYNDLKALIEEVQTSCPEAEEFLGAVAVLSGVQVEDL